MNSESSKTGRFWRDELASPAFLSGMAEAIRYTVRTGNEAGFLVEYDPSGFGFIYPDKIMVGNHGVVGFRVPLNLVEVSERYRAETGEVLAVCENQEWLNGLRSSPLNAEGLRAAEERAESWLRKHPEATLDISYPYTEDWGRKNESSHAESLPGLMYTAIAFHTHPKRALASPSGVDLITLNKFRRENVKIAKCDSVGGQTIPNCVTVIAAIGDSERDRYDIVVMQEKTPVPLPSKSKFGRMVCEMGGKEERLLAAVFGNSTPRVRDCYNTVHATYYPREDPQRRALVLNRVPRSRWASLEEPSLAA